MSGSLPDIALGLRHRFRHDLEDDDSGTNVLVIPPRLRPPPPQQFVTTCSWRQETGGQRLDDPVLGLAHIRFEEQVPLVRHEDAADLAINVLAVPASTFGILT